MPSVHELRAAHAREGVVTWMGVRPERRTPMQAIEVAQFVADRGIEGDRASRRAGGRRQVSFIQAEHLPVIASLSGHGCVAPELLRRNVVVAHLNLLTLHSRRFRLGEAVLEWSGHAHPCSRMEEALGHGGYSAVRGHGGILARVLRGGRVQLGDALVPEAEGST